MQFHPPSIRDDLGDNGLDLAPILVESELSTSLPVTQSAFIQPGIQKEGKVNPREQ